MDPTLITADLLAVLCVLLVLSAQTQQILWPVHLAPIHHPDKPNVLSARMDGTLITADLVAVEYVLQDLSVQIQQMLWHVHAAPIHHSDN
jgi:hypothetical protein